MKYTDIIYQRYLFKGSSVSKVIKEGASVREIVRLEKQPVSFPEHTVLYFCQVLGDLASSMFLCIEDPLTKGLYFLIK